MFNHEISKISYVISITVDQLIYILDLDNNLNKGLYEYLEEIKGVSRIDYDGHFGPYIYLDIDYDVDNKETWESINNCILMYLKREIE